MPASSAATLRGGHGGVGRIDARHGRVDLRGRSIPAGQRGDRTLGGRRGRLSPGLPRRRRASGRRPGFFPFPSAASAVRVFPRARVATGRGPWPRWWPRRRSGRPRRWPRSASRHLLDRPLLAVAGRSRTPPGRCAGLRIAALLAHNERDELGSGVLHAARRRLPTPPSAAASRALGLLSFRRPSWPSRPRRWPCADLVTAAMSSRAAVSAASLSRQQLGDRGGRLLGPLDGRRRAGHHPAGAVERRPGDHRHRAAGDNETDQHLAGRLQVPARAGQARATSS